MNDQNRYEEVPQKENKFKKALKALGSYLKYVFVDFFNSFKYNNMKLAAILFALPGILLGFFMFAHVPTIRHVTQSYRTPEEGSQVTITTEVNDDSADDKDYYLNIEKYTINGKEYNGIVLQLDTTLPSKTDDLPVDGSAVSDKTALSQPVVELVQLSSEDEDGIVTYSDEFEVRISGLSDTEKNNIARYVVFIYKIVDGKDYYTGVPYSLATTSSTINVNNLDVGASKYKVAIKAIAMDDSNYYTSPLSEITAFEVMSKGAKFDSADTAYIQYRGNYIVKDATDGSDLSKFSVNIDSDGSVVYSDGAANKTVEASLSGSGSNLSSLNMLKVNILPFDFSGMCIFFLTLLGFLNVFLSLELSKKKNLGTVVKCSLTTLGIVLLGVLYIYAIFTTESYLKKEVGGLKLADGSKTIINSDAIISIVAVIASIVFSLAGLVLAFINYDRTYEKVDR